jgi:hypothetical protein
MNRPIENPPPRSPGDDRLLDRLVDGELPEVERRELLIRFENEPDGWRRCALAFLEAQTWRQALRSLVPFESGGPDTLVWPDKSVWPTAGRHRWRVVGRLTGIAAGLTVAFALGWGFHRGPENPAHSERVVEQAAPVDSQQSTPVRAETGQSKPPKPAELAQMDPFLKACQQRGYSVKSQQRLVSVQLNDGRKVKIPVQEVRLVYVGDRTY